MIRLLLWNANGIGFVSHERSLESLKMEKLKKLLITHEVDIAGITELNKNWKKVDTNHNIWAATRSWFQNHCVQTSCNRHFNSSTSKLTGGTALMALNDLSFCISSQFEDVRGLGRWSSFTFRGKNNKFTTVFNCY